MRIRKNSFSSSLTSGVEPHICQLNQSPWDLIPSPPLSQFLRDDDSYNIGNESLCDSIGAVDSVWSMNNHPPTTKNLITDVVDDYNKISEDNHEKKLRKSSSQAVGSKRRDCGKMGGGKRVKKGHTTSSSANPYEFYYYSGFGPSWGRKKRGEMSNTIIEKEEDMTRPLTGNKSSLNLLYIDDDEEDEEWTRKPVKARSLKLLMS